MQGFVINQPLHNTCDLANVAVINGGDKRIRYTGGKQDELCVDSAVT